MIFHFVWESLALSWWFAMLYIKVYGHMLGGSCTWVMWHFSCDVYVVIAKMIMEQWLDIKFIDDNYFITKLIPRNSCISKDVYCKSIDTNTLYIMPIVHQLLQTKAKRVKGTTRGHKHLHVYKSIIIELVRFEYPWYIWSWYACHSPISASTRQLYIVAILITPPILTCNQIYLYNVSVESYGYCNYKCILQLPWCLLTTQYNEKVGRDSFVYL